jgi:hypothetical protein
MNKKTYKDFDSRELFVQSLQHWHYDKWIRNAIEYRKILQIDQNTYSYELGQLKQNLELIKQQWNDQSLLRIRQEIARTANSHTNLEILAGQEQDRLKAGYPTNKSMYHVKQVESDSVWESIGQQFGLKDAVTRLHVQFPGDVTAWHADIFAPYHDLLPNTCLNSKNTVGQDIGLRRIIIALEDWDWGQCFMFGSHTWSQWHAGDVIYWNFGVPHCAANMGLTPRICMSVTGTSTELFKTLVARDDD